LSSVSFYSSYIWGYQTDIKQRFPVTELERQQQICNLAAAFLSLDQNHYTIDQRKYPAPFDTLYCETDEEAINFSQPYLKRFSDEYQFYTIIERRVATTKVGELVNVSEPLYRRHLGDSITVLVYKDKVVDLSGSVSTAPGYYNYSRLFLNPGDV